ncbi:phage minor tail U family protein [Escherichia coli]|uniref:phage minor tail U family protein n=1 Tax=Escherichia coli TaxID=562 RepID=UPI00203018EE|nr:phage minor tail U family protein [Escherichia coli]MCM1618306.1 phage minor tail U family protein [Escherichia coli]
MTPGRRFFDVRPAFFDEADYPAVAVYLTGPEYTGRRRWTVIAWQAELHIEVFCLLRCRIQSWIRGWSPRIYPVMSDIPALSD